MLAFPWVDLGPSFMWFPETVRQWLEPVQPPAEQAGRSSICLRLAVVAQWIVAL
jgi:hypothetical protein